MDEDLAKLKDRIKRLEKIINSIYWGVQDESDTQAIAVYIEQEAPECVNSDSEKGGSV